MQTITHTENIQSQVKSPVAGCLSDPDNVTQSWAKVNKKKTKGT